MMREFKAMGKMALSMTHYDLEANSATEYDAEDWRNFLSDPDVKSYIKREMEIIRQTSINKLVQSSIDSRSVAQTQALSALAKLEDNTPKKDGPVFIYCHVPLTDEQKYAPNAQEYDQDA